MRELVDLLLDDGIEGGVQNVVEARLLLGDDTVQIPEHLEVACHDCEVQEGLNHNLEVLVLVAVVLEVSGPDREVDFLCVVEAGLHSFEEGSVFGRKLVAVVVGQVSEEAYQLDHFLLHVDRELFLQETAHFLSDELDEGLGVGVGRVLQQGVTVHCNQSEDFDLVNGHVLVLVLYVGP